MLHEISQAETTCLKSLISPLDYHLVIESILAGKTPGIIFADHPTHPQAAWINFKHHCFLVGKPELPVFNQDLKEYIHQNYIPKARAAGQEALLFDYQPATWSKCLEELIPGMQPQGYLRKYFTCQSLAGDWRTLLPQNFTVVKADTALLAQIGLKNLAAVREEMCSERTSVEDFLNNSFGFCIQYGNELVAWAFSEYNSHGRCEVGIATIEKYRRMGLGTVTALALVEYALETGYHTLGWHCWANNIPSAALARRAGFEHQLDYDVKLFLL